jgi:DNA-directed RNA polymerase specialized sigma24 family protein
MTVIVHAPLQPMTTTDLLRAAAAGDQAAWRELVHRFEPAVASTIVAHRLQHADAHDAAQRTWLRMIEHQHSIREPEALGGWLRTTARHECLRIIRDRQRVEPLGDAEGAEFRDAAVHVEQSIVDADTVNRLRSLVDVLPPRAGVHGSTSALGCAAPTCIGYPCTVLTHTVLFELSLGEGMRRWTTDTARKRP